MENRESGDQEGYETHQAKKQLPPQEARESSEGQRLFSKDAMFSGQRRTNEQDRDNQAFQEHYPNARIETTNETLPPKVETFFRERGYDETDQTNVIRYADGTSTYVFTNPNQIIFPGYEIEATCLVDTDRDGQAIGMGVLSLRKNTDDPFDVNKPFCNYTYTEQDHRGEGLGKRRIEVMHALAKMKYGFPLYSEGDTSAAQTRLWRQLVREGKAENFTDTKAGKPIKRFVFTGKDSSQ